TYSSHTVGWVSSMPQVPYVDAVASIANNGTSLRLIVINKDMDRDMPFRVDIAGASAGQIATVHSITGTGVDANTGTQLFQAPGVRWAAQATHAQNPRFERGAPTEIQMESKQIAASPNGLSLVLPRFSIVSIEVPLR